MDFMVLPEMMIPDKVDEVKIHVVKSLFESAFGFCDAILVSWCNLLLVQFANRATCQSNHQLDSPTFA